MASFDYSGHIELDARDVIDEFDDVELEELTALLAQRGYQAAEATFEELMQSIEARDVDAVLGCCEKLAYEARGRVVCLR